LQAPRSLKNPARRHTHASIGHAVSQDLRKWDVLPDVLAPNRAVPDAWDSRATWTGSILRHQDLWYLFYTGVSLREGPLVQRVGLATSTDLLHWERCGDTPLIEADPRWYELSDPDIGNNQAWRDPWVFRHPASGDFHALITARSKEDPVDARGVIAHARSDDLLHWEVLPPVTAPGEFDQLEVPQLVTLNGHYYLLFSTTADATGALRQHRLGTPPVTGTHYLVAGNPLGPFRYTTDTFLMGDTLGSRYAGKLVRAPDGNWVFLAWCMHAPDGTFIGELADPLPIRVDKAGALHIDSH